MGAFWDAWDRQNVLRDQRGQAAMQQAQGLAGLMKEARAAEDATAVRGLLSNPSLTPQQRIEGLMRLGPAGVQVAGQIAVMEDRQAKMDKDRRASEFWRNEAPKFQTPATPEIRGQSIGMLGSDLQGPALPGQGGILQPARPAGVDMEGLVNAGAMAGVISPETVMQHRQLAADRAAARQDRMDALQMQIADREAARQDASALKVQLAEMQAEGRKDAAQSRLDAIRLAASLRPPRQEVAPSYTQVQDPNDPNKTLVVDGRVYKPGTSIGAPGVYGHAPKLTDVGKANAANAGRREGVETDIADARDLLSGIRRDPVTGSPMDRPTPTASGVGALVDWAGAKVGYSAPGSAEAARLEAIAARLTSRVPRFEGPQSDKDVVFYKQMAGDVGNREKPLKDRLEALDQIEKLYRSYSDGSRGRVVEGSSQGNSAAGTIRQPLAAQEGWSIRIKK